ncbi:hypothetical protein Cgig2_004737 [Carnegiea gigantea]|uniref:Glutamate receptor n=1 Tax=Carnegiea gigantea TaxID=171969 RepID=A0A9Q1KWB9_9CARY|nr:hypothetical protein Cgig2_004737 [Carnegiea gigantea]
MKLSVIYTAKVLLLLLMLYSKSIANFGARDCSMHGNATVRIGVVVDQQTRVGKEEEIAMKIAVRDLRRSSCLKLTLHFRDTYHRPTAVATSSVLKVIHDKKIHGLVGRMPLSEAAVLSHIHKKIAFFLTTPTAIYIPPTLPSARSSNLIQFSNNLSIHLQCLAAIIGHFQWRTVTVIYEQTNSFSLHSGIVTAFSDQLKSVSATVEQHLGFKPYPENAVEEGLRRLKIDSNRVFVVLHCSLELVTRLFQKANQMGMLENGFVWIVSDEVASLLDSFDSSVVASMQGVIGYRTFFDDTTKSFKEFKIKFEQSYLAKYPGHGNPNPSLFALRAYDAMQAIAKARNDLAGTCSCLLNFFRILGFVQLYWDHFKFRTDFKANETKQEIETNRTSHPKSLLPILLKTNFEGLSGNVSFKYGELQNSPTFQIINVAGKSYRELALWTPELGFTKQVSLRKTGRTNHSKPQSYDRAIDLGPIYWPGGQQIVPRGWTYGVSKEKPLRLGVPAAGVFHQFVNVSMDVAQNKTFVTGFAVDVFNASLKHLPYELPYVFVPFYDTYDAMVHEIHKKGFHGAIGDINILQKRYEWADFTQPYVKSGLKMVVTQKEEKIREMWIFMTVFEKQMWIIIPLMGLFTGFVVWTIERHINPEFGGESPRSTLSKLVLAPWYFLVAMIFIYFQAALTSEMTISQLQPSVTDVETLRRENAGVGCNWNSFICTYLVQVLHFKPENVKHIRSIDEYPVAFQRGEIKAAFFISSHAQVFLAIYCTGYTLAGPTFNFGGLGFAFSKGSSLSIDMSQAMLKATENGEIDTLMNTMLSYYNCSSSTTNNSSITSVGPKPFSGLFYICGGISLLALFFSLLPLVKKGCKYLNMRLRVLATMVIIMFCRTHHSRPTLRQTSNSSVTLNEVNCS